MLNLNSTSQQNNRILIGILLVACALRLHDFLNFPLSHDEYSAILRTHYSTFHDLIEHGVKPDFHPAGVQLFLFVWVKIFGTDPWIIKLPFVVASIASVYLGYLVAKKWTNETVGLIVAAFLATSQYMITQGTFARPYASGLFFSLLLVLTITNFIQHPGHKFWRNWILFVLAGTICAYNHYVSMLIVGFIGISAFPLIPKEIRLKYILAGVSIGILYLPHLSILSFHMSKGGVGGPEGWLAAPEPRFAFDYLSYLFHYSIWSVVLILFVLLAGWYFGRNENYTPNFSFSKRLYVFICWLVIPFLICYFYSVHKNPILQFSVLIFSHFTLYIFLFGHIKPLKSIGNAVVVSAILLVNVLTLVFVRQHFYVHYKIDYSFTLEELEKERRTHINLPALINTDYRISDYLQKKWNRTIPFDKFEFENNLQLLTYLDSISANNDYFYFVEAHNTQQNTVPIIQRFFPKIEKQLNLQTSVIYLFSKNGKQDFDATVYEWTPSSKLPGKWNNMNADKLISQDGKWYYQLDSLIEWGPDISFDLKNIVATTNNMIDIEVDVKNLQIDKDVVITALIRDDKDSTVHWTGSGSIQQILNGKCDKINHSISVPKMDYIKNNYELNVMIWNVGKSTFLVEKVSIRMREGNPYRYSLFYPIYPTVISELKGLQPR
jgi:hypothetical protein